MVEFMNSFSNNLKGTKAQDIVLPTEEQLQEISCLSSFGKSLNKQSLTQELLDCAIKDSARFYNELLEVPFLYGYCWRVKSEQSIRLKYEKGLKNQLRFNTVFNDIVGIRIKVPEYPTNFPSYYRVVDMRKGKKHYDGYKAIHLYYKMDNYHYQVEIQLWSAKDYDFNNWSHSYGYKTLDDSELVKLRELCDSGVITSKEQFREAVLSDERGK